MIAIVKRLLTAALVLCATTATVLAYPDKPVRVVVPFAPGGGTDIVARYIFQRLNERTGKVFVIENIGGANGSIGAASVASAPPDGYTLLYASSSVLINNTFAYEDTSYSTSDFAPVVIASNSIYSIITTSRLNVSTVDELVKLAKERPGELRFGSAGIGNATHLAGELFMASTGIDMLHVPYKAASEYTVALLSGEVDLIFGGVGDVQRMGPEKVKVLGVMAEDRVSLLPDVPTLRELGIQNGELFLWLCVVAPAGTPSEIVDWLNTEINSVLAEEKTIAFIESQGQSPGGGTAQEFAAQIEADIPRARQLLELAGLLVKK